MKIFKSFFIVLIYSVFLSSYIFASTIHVPDDYPTIQLALNYATYSDTVLVTTGIYYENITWPEIDCIKLIGNEGADATIISGSGTGPVIEIVNVDSNTVIKGFTIKNGHNAGGINAYNCDFQLVDLIITENYRDNGGGIYLWGGSKPTLRNVIISNNEANKGGGIYFDNFNEYGDTLRLFNVTIKNNCANQGAGMYFDGSKIISENVKIINNNGWGIYIYNYSDTLKNFIVSGHDQGIQTRYGSFIISNCDINNNESWGIMINGGGISVQNCTICNNGNGIYATDWLEAANVSHSNIFNNLNYGINALEHTSLFSAENNWWGDITGPYHSTYNPNGLGDSVSIYVDVLPFLTEPDTIAPPPPVQELSIDSIGNDFITVYWISSPISDLAGYKVYFDTDTSCFPYDNVIDVGIDTSFILSGLVTGVIYYIAVTCYDDGGNESWYSSEIVASPELIPIISTSISDINFNSTIIGDTSKSFVRILNIGTAKLNISDILSSNSQFIPDSINFSIPANDSIDLSILFIPNSYGVISGNLTICSNAYNNDSLSIPIEGFGDLSPSPEILSIIDIPYDQGGNVRIKFSRSKYDGLDSTYKIVSYTVWRLIENSEWDAIGMFNAVQDSFYYYVAPTLGDSTIHGIIWATFKVSAHTENPDFFFYSDSLRGYSIDNIAPGVPEGLLAKESDDNILLTWQSNKEKDFQYYGIYRSTCSNFDPDTMEVYTYATSDTFFSDTDIKSNTNYYYRVSAFDYSGNESEYSPEVTALVVGLQSNGENVPKEYSLSQNYPNPFNPTTTISYQLPKSSFVKLTIYDLSGRLIETLVNEKKNAGYYSVDLIAYNFSSGIYFYRIDAGEFSSVKKCLVVK